MNELELQLIPQMGMKVSPRLVAANHILELSSMELQQVIGQELDENPALEKIEEPTCGVCGAAMRGSICPHCLSQQKQETPQDDYAESYDEYHIMQGGPNAADDDFDPLTQVADQMSLAEHLIMELRPMIPPEALAIAEYLIGNLDDRGWLSCTVEEVSRELNVPIVLVEHVLQAMQQLEPLGVGARDLRECLLIQLRYLDEEEGIKYDHAERIVSDFLVELGEHKFGRIAHALRISHEEVERVCNFIKTRLNPYPAHVFSPGSGKNSRQSHVVPDVIITRRDDAFDVDVLESKRFFLRVAPLYQQLASDLSREPARFSDEERQHIQQYVTRAKLFIQNINQRRQTLHRITSCLVGNQREFLDKGIRFLRPLTRAAIANELGIHESTVSRATAEKFVMLPSRQVVAFSVFFCPSLSVKDVIKELIERETTPLTDQEIAGLLDDRGIHIARRTVAKYREQLKILPSPLR